MTYLEALLLFVLTYAALWGLWHRFFAPRPVQSPERKWATTEEIRQEIPTLEPPLYSRQSWRN